jgi:hypothetical protein
MGLFSASALVETGEEEEARVFRVDEQVSQRRIVPRWCVCNDMEDVDSISALRNRFVEPPPHTLHRADRTFEC